VSFKECPESVVVKALPVDTVTLFCDKREGHDGAHHDADNGLRWKED
jgi:hypothetical protein